MPKILLKISYFRDTYNLNGPSNPDGSYDDGLVMKLKPFYYTCLIPLDDISEENGRTEFIHGSHCLTYQEAKTMKGLNMMLKPDRFWFLMEEYFTEVVLIHPAHRGKLFI